MNRDYVIDVISRRSRHWWRIRRVGNNKVILASETYTEQRKALAAAGAFARSMRERGDVKIVVRTKA